MAFIFILRKFCLYILLLFVNQTQSDSYFGFSINAKLLVFLLMLSFVFLLMLRFKETVSRYRESLGESAINPRLTLSYI